MTAQGYLDILVSREGILITAQCAMILFMVSGLCIMIGQRRFARRLIVLALVLIVVPVAIGANHDEIELLLATTPKWLLSPVLVLGGAIAFCWVLWGIIALSLGSAIANRVVADILIWLIKGLIIAVLAPYKGIAGLLRRSLSNDASD